MTAVIVDDEALARALLRQLLEAKGVTILAEAGDVDEVTPIIEELTPDLVFLDVRMPGMSGIEATGVFTQFEPAPLVVLVTGFSEYAVEAFEKSALDYLLKPVSPERLEITLSKARKQLAFRKRASKPKPLNRLPIRTEKSFRIVPVETILYAQASAKAVIVKTKSTEYRTNYTLSYLEETLPSQFMRVHSSCIVNLAAVEELLIEGNHSYAVKMVNGAELPVARQRYQLLQERLGFPNQS